MVAEERKKRPSTMIDIIKTESQEKFDYRYRDLIREILEVVQAAIPETANDRQWTSVRTLLNSKLYGFEKEFLEKYIK